MNDIYNNKDPLSEYETQAWTFYKLKYNSDNTIDVKVFKRYFDLADGTFKVKVLYDDTITAKSNNLVLRGYTDALYFSQGEITDEMIEQMNQ